MDTEVWKTMLEIQDKAYKNALELFVKQNDKNMQSFQTSLNDYSRSLEFTQSEFDEMRQEVKQLQRARRDDQEIIRSLTDNLQVKSDLLKELEERCNYQEDYSRRNNLQIIGIEENHDETWEQCALKVTKLLDEKLQIPNCEIERAHRVGQRTEHRHRPIIARFTRFCNREAALRNAAKLRGTRIFINEDLCLASQNIRKEKLPLLKQARNEGKIAYFRHTRLVIKERQGSRRMSGDAGAGEPLRSDGSLAAAASSARRMDRDTGAGRPLRSDGSLAAAAPGARRVDRDAGAGEPLCSEGSLAAVASGARRVDWDAGADEPLQSAGSLGAREREGDVAAAADGSLQSAGSPGASGRDGDTAIATGGPLHSYASPGATKRDEDAAAGGPLLTEGSPGVAADTGEDHSAGEDEVVTPQRTTRQQWTRNKNKNKKKH